MKKILLPVFFVVIFLAGAYLTHRYYTREAYHRTENIQVLLEKIKTVTKLITVEGYFSEIYDYKDYYKYDFSFLRKKALLRVKAKVSMGYDLTKIVFEPNEKTKIITVSNVPDPEILSIDHDIDYYDIQEGTFNYFTEADLTKLNEDAKRFIMEKAKESELNQIAEKHFNKIMDIINEMATAAGWKLEFKTRYEENAIPDVNPLPERH